MLTRTLSMATMLIDSMQKSAFATHQSVNEQLEDYSPTSIIAGTIVGTIAGLYLLKKTCEATANTIQFVQKNWPTPFFNKKQLQKSMAQILHDAPIVGPIIEKEASKELDKLSVDLQKNTDKKRKALGPVFAEIPQKGQSKDFIINIMSKASEEYEQKLKGRVSGMMYVGEDKEYSDLIDKTYSLTKLTNPMHDDEFSLIDKMTAEVLAMCQTLLGGDISQFNSEKNKKLAGLFTDGGTSSIMEACRAYVKHARSQGIKEPEIIVPSTAHAAFKNAAETLGVKLI